MNLSPIVLLHTDKPEDSIEVLLKHHADLDIVTCNTYNELPDTLHATGAEVVYSVRFDGTPTFPREELLDTDTVKWISVAGSGTDHLFPWDPARITVTNTAGVAADMMAEYVLGCVLSFRLNLRDFTSAQRQRRWTNGSVTPLQGSTALLVGLGYTGQAVARRFSVMGMRGLGVRSNPAATNFVDEVYPVSELVNLLPNADVVVIAVPLLDSTRNLLSSREFSAMRENVILVDVSRGGVLDEQALLTALERSDIEGAALDVFAEEPLPEGHPFWDMENLILTPHCSSVYDGWELRSVEMFAENLQRYRGGQSLDRVVDPERGY